MLQQHDQDHYGGTAATDRLIPEAGVKPEDLVLDVCSGMGGPARYLAWKTGCDVTGLDLTASRVEGATELTRLAGLAGQCASSTAMRWRCRSRTLRSRSPSPRNPLLISRTSHACRRVRARAATGRPAGVLGHPAPGKPVGQECSGCSRA